MGTAASTSTPHPKKTPDAKPRNTPEIALTPKRPATNPGEPTETKTHPPNSGEITETKTRPLTKHPPEYDQEAPSTIDTSNPDTKETVARTTTTTTRDPGQRIAEPTRIAPAPPAHQPHQRPLGITRTTNTTQDTNPEPKRHPHHHQV